MEERKENVPLPQGTEIHRRRRKTSNPNPVNNSPAKTPPKHQGSKGFFVPIHLKTRLTAQLIHPLMIINEKTPEPPSSIPKDAYEGWSRGLVVRSDCPAQDSSSRCRYHQNNYTTSTIICQYSLSVSYCGNKSGNTNY